MQYFPSPAALAVAATVAASVPVPVPAPDLAAFSSSSSCRSFGFCTVETIITASKIVQYASLCVHRSCDDAVSGHWIIC